MSAADRSPRAHYCSTSVAARRLGLSLGTVQHMVEQGVLEAWKTAGGHRRISVASVEAFIRHQHAPHPGAAPATEPARAAALRVLIAEDDPLLHTLYRKTLGAWPLPLTLDITASGYDVLLEVGRQPPDLLILDLMMPGMDGFEMIRRIREHGVARDMDIVVVSSLTAEEIARAGGLPPDIVVYGKPVPFHELRGYLQALNARRLRGQA